jgi:hypothetical protein
MTHVANVAIMTTGYGEGGYGEGRYGGVEPEPEPQPMSVEETQKLLDDDEALSPLRLGR